MARPMTAKDRRPEVGDVLEWQGDAYIVYRHYLASIELRSPCGIRFAYPSTVNEWRFAWRKDGGPITVEGG